MGTRSSCCTHPPQPQGGLSLGRKQHKPSTVDFVGAYTISLSMKLGSEQAKLQSLWYIKENQEGEALC